MPTSSRSKFGPARWQGFTLLHLILIVVGLAPFALLMMGAISGCTAAERTTVARDAKAVGRTIEADASSPEAQRILAKVTSTALNAGLDVLTGNETGAISTVVIAGIQGAASAIRSYEGLPSAPSAATIAQAAATGSGVPSVAQAALSGTATSPSLAAIISKAQQTAKQKHVSLSTDAITEAAARGLDAVASAKYIPPTNLAGTSGEAP